MFFDRKLIIDFFADGGFEEKTYLSIVDFHHFTDDLGREAMDGDFFVVFPYQDVLFLDVNADNFFFTVEIQVLYWIFVRLSIEEGLCVVLKLPALHSLV